MAGRGKQYLFPGGDMAHRLYGEFREAFLPNKEAEREWIEQASKKYKVPPRELRVILAEQDYAFARKARAAIDTEAEIVAGRIGLTLTKALGVLDAQLEATKRRPLTDKDGRMLRDPCDGCGGTGRKKYEGEKRTRKCQECDGRGGEPLWIETPDNMARLQAVDKAMKIFGAFRPDKVEIEGHISLSEVSLQDINERLRAILPKVINATATRVVGPAPDRIGCSGTGAALPGTEDPEMLVRSSLLADDIDEDAGRAGSEDPVQSVSQEALPEAGPGLFEQLSSQEEVHP